MATQMEADSLYLTDKEIGRRLGFKADAVASRLQVLEKAGFPAADPFFDGRRYWPAVKEFLDRRNGLAADRRGAEMPLQPDGRENW